MSRAYDYRTYEIQFYAPHEALSAELWQLGDEGWEPYEIHGEYMSSKRLLLLRRPQRDLARRTWEIRLFPAVDMPEPEWRNHLASCGWMLLSPLPSSSLDPFYLARRGSEWRGSDDGDVPGRLKDLGYPVYHDRSRTIRAILKTKWILSEQMGRNAGTWEAVKRWLAYEVLPQLVAENGFVLENRKPEHVLEEVLILKAELKEPGFDAAVARWCEIQKTRL
jgi:hypothetical protein